MDIVDKEIAEAEITSSRSYHNRPSHEIERMHSHTSTTTTSSSAADNDDNAADDPTYRPIGMSRIDTQPDLERHPTELGRIATQRSQHSHTVGRTVGSVVSRRMSRKPLPPFGAGKAYPPLLPEQEQYVVEFDGPDDPLHAQNWPMRKKLVTAAVLGYTTMTAAFASSIFSAAIPAIGIEFGVGRVVSTLGVSLYVLGFAFGPTFWAPLSELRGRRLPLLIAMFGFTLFCAGTATAKDLQTVMICRFFAGLFASCPLAVVVAVFSDMFTAQTRGLAVTLFSMAVFSGPLLSPFIGGFIVQSHLGWRWTQYLVCIMGGVAFVLDVVFLSETYPPMILVDKASELRRRTLNWGIHAKQEEIEVDFRELVSKNFSRPMRLLFGEPIVTLVSVYTAFIYGILYLFLAAYPIVFQGVHHMSPGVGGLPFFGMIVGELLAGVAVVLQQPWYLRKLAANNGVPIPEWRLPIVMAGGIVFAAGIFWFGWAGYRPDIHWIVPTLSGLFTGFGLMSIFLQAINYLVDAYLVFAASVIAGNTFLRSLFGAAFPLFASAMFDNLGIEWASTVLGCIGVALIPIPVFFYLYGGKIRARSNFAVTLPTDGGADVLDEESRPGTAVNTAGATIEKARTGSVANPSANGAQTRKEQ